MDEFNIRKATSDDYECVIDLYGLFVENQDRYSGLDNDSYHKVIGDPNSILEVAIVNDQIIAFIMYSIRNVVRYPKPIIEVEEFFVLNEFRRMKIGKKLMDRVFDQANQRDCQYVFLASGKDRVPAHMFYKNYGFLEYAFHYRKAI